MPEDRGVQRTDLDRYDAAIDDLDETSIEDIRAQVGRIHASPEFQVPDRAHRFLDYIVEETLAGRADRIKAYSVALEVFGRDPSFDAQSDPVVRIEAGRLRRALERYYLTAGSHDPIMISIPKGGYVPLFASQAQPVEAVEPAPSAPAPAAPRAPLDPRWAWAGLAVSIMMVAALVMLRWFESSEFARTTESTASRATASSASPPAPVVVVQPFEDLTGTAQSAIVTRGLTDEIIGQLGRFSEIVVVLGEGASNSSPTEYGGRPVRYALTGSMRVGEVHMRLVTRLENTIDKSVVWTQIYSAELDVRSVLDVQAEIAGSIVSTLAQPHGVMQREDALKDIGGSGTADWEAYICTLSYYAYRATFDAETHATVQDCLLEAVGRYPDYAAAWALLSLTYLDQVRFEYRIGRPGASPIEDALDAALRAVALDPENARAQEAHMLALFFNGEWKAALDIGERALANHPNDSELLGEYGDKLAMTGEWERGTDMMLDALDRNQGPRSFYSVALASCYYMLSDYATAVRWITEATADGNPIYHLVAAAVFGKIGDAERVQRHREWIVANAAGFLTRINEQLSIRGMKPEDQAHFIDGLRKAGLPIPEAS